MIITNKKKFDKVCRVMTDFCKKEKKTMNERLFHNRITVSKNFFVATDGKNMVIRDCSDCVDNKDNFSFPLDAKIAKESITVDGLTIVVDGKETDMMDLEKQVPWDRVVPDGKYIEKRIHFQKIPAIKAGDESYVTFKNDEIVFDYNDDTETTGFYGDVYLNDILADQCDIEEFSLPMKIFYRILHLSKDVVLRQYEVGYKPRVFMAGDYKVVCMPMNNLGAL